MRLKNAKVVTGSTAKESFETVAAYFLMLSLLARFKNKLQNKLDT